MKFIAYAVFIFFASLSYAAPKDKAPAVNYEDEYGISKNTFYICLEESRRQLDDGISDALTVAKTIKLRCYKPYKDMLFNECMTSKDHYKSKDVCRDLTPVLANKNENYFYSYFVDFVLSSRVKNTLK